MPKRINCIVIPFADVKRSVESIHLEHLRQLRDVSIDFIDYVLSEGEEGKKPMRGCYFAWREYIPFLAKYLIAICSEIKNRGGAFAPSLRKRLEKLAAADKNHPEPEWLKDKKVLTSHKRYLYFKDETWYKRKQFKFVKPKGVKNVRPEWPKVVKPVFAKNIEELMDMGYMFMVEKSKSKYRCSFVLRNDTEVFAGPWTDKYPKAIRQAFRAFCKHKLEGLGNG